MSLTKRDLGQIEQILDRKLEEKLEQKLEEKLNKKLANFATKEDLQNTEERIIKKVIARIDSSQEELALITKSGFDEVIEKITNIETTKRVRKLESQMGELKTALHIS